MKKISLCFIVLLLAVSMIAMFSCKPTTKTAAETTAAETTAAETTAAETTAAETTAAETTAAETTAPENPNLKFMVVAENWYDYDDQLISDFEKATGYKVEVEKIPGGTEAYDLVLSRFLTGEGVPDILLWDGNIAGQKLIVVDQNIIDITGRKWFDNLKEDILKNIQVDGKNYGIPYSGAGFNGFIYRKDIFEAANVEIPKNMTEMLEVTMPKLKEAGYQPEWGMGKDRWGFGYDIGCYISDQYAETDVFEKVNRNEAKFINTDMYEYFKYAKTMVDNGYWCDDLLIGTYEGIIQEFKKDDSKVAIFCCTSFVFNNWEGAALDRLGMFTASKETDRYNSSNPGLYFIPKLAGNIKGAEAFLDWYTQTPNQEKYYTDAKSVSLWKGFEGVVNPLAKDLLSRYSGIPSTSIQWAAETGMIGGYVADIVTGVSTPEEAIDELQQTFEKNAKAAGVPGF